MNTCHLQYHDEISALDTALNFAPTILFAGLLLHMSRHAESAGGGGPGGSFSIGKSRADLFNKDADVPIKFKDVGGIGKAKEEIMEFVKFLKEPHTYEKLGAKIPRGAILSRSKTNDLHCNVTINCDVRMHRAASRASTDVSFGTYCWIRFRHTSK